MTSVVCGGPPYLRGSVQLLLLLLKELIVVLVLLKLLLAAVQQQLPEVYRLPWFVRGADFELGGNTPVKTPVNTPISGLFGEPLRCPWLIMQGKYEVDDF